jgi:hypothetical protein
MRVLVVVCLALGFGLAASPALAQEAELLRRELEQLKQQLQIMQQQYQKTIQDMTDRLQRLEAQPPAAPPPPAAGTPTSPAPVVTGAPATAPRPSSQISALDLARPREPFSLYERRGPGQLLLDIGVAGNFVGDFTLNRGGSMVPFVSFPGEANRFGHARLGPARPPTGATVACMFGLLLLLWSGALRARRLGQVAATPSLHSVESALTDKGAPR